MIWVGLLFGTGLFFQSWKMRKAKERRVWFLQISLIVLGLMMVSMVEWRLHLLFDPLRLINIMFGSVTKWIYQTL